MSTPTGPRRSDESIDEPVRHLLWRLRARLVTPPPEDRVQADLDRLFELAHEQAHESPSAQASASPDDDAMRPPDHPLAEAAVLSPGPTARRLRILGRCGRLVPVVGRTAAAVLIVLAGAIGLAGSRDGAVSLDAFLGRGTSPAEPVAGPPMIVPSDPETTPDGDGGPGATSPEQDSASAPGPDPAGEATEGPPADTSEPAGDPEIAADDPGSEELDEGASAGEGPDGGATFDGRDPDDGRAGRGAEDDASDGRAPTSGTDEAETDPKTGSGERSEVPAGTGDELATPIDAEGMTRAEQLAARRFQGH